MRHRASHPSFKGRTVASFYHRIFAAIDGSATESAVIERTLQIASANGAEILFGHVVDSLPSDMNSTNAKLLAEEEEKLMRERLAPVFERIEADPSIPEYDFQLRVGRVADVLLDDLIEPYEPDLVICGERGYSNFKYAFVGSVSKRIVHDAKCDVLVVKPKDLQL